MLMWSWSCGCERLWKATGTFLPAGTLKLGWVLRQKMRMEAMMKKTDVIASTCVRWNGMFFESITDLV